MSNSTPQRNRPPQNPLALIGWLRSLWHRLILAWRLMRDPRIPVTTKIIPWTTLAYLISPIDIISDAIPGLGQLDDLTLFLFGMQLFIDLCPPEIVAEHLAIIEGRTDPNAASTPVSGPVIDVEVIEPEDKSKDSPSH